MDTLKTRSNWHRLRETIDADTKAAPRATFYKGMQLMTNASGDRCLYRVVKNLGDAQMIAGLEFQDIDIGDLPDVTDEAVAFLLARQRPSLPA